MQTQLEFVFSAFPHYMKMCRQRGEIYKETAKSVQQTIKHLRTKLGEKVKFSALFNAYTEEDCVRNASERFEGMKAIIGGNLYADSGGLQMVTLGKKTVTEAMRKKIYETQIKYSDLAFCFDEIPAEVIDDKRYYYPDKIKQAGIQTGLNLKEQYDFFQENNAITKIIPIMQGYGDKDITDFFNGVYNQTKDIWDNFEMVATGFQSSNSYATTKQVVSLKRLEGIQKQFSNHLHLLGMSGYKRLIPVILLIKNGLLGKMKTLSFDSSSLSMTYVMGNVVGSTNDLKNNKKWVMGKKRTDEVVEYYTELFDFWKDDPNFVYKDVNDLLESSQWNSRGIKSGKARFDETDGDVFETIKYLKQEEYFIFYNVYKYIMVLEDFLEGKITLEEIFKGKDLDNFLTLSKLTNLDDFDSWLQEIEKTKKIGPEIMKKEDNSGNLLF